jgi:glycosyltransferase involved in cell wall biosynthesis
MTHNNSGSVPLVSIGVPVYNGENYLTECLDSIYKQTYQNWECFVINNQSTDKSLEIAQSFENSDKRFKVITNPEFVDMTTNFNNTIKPISNETKYFKVVCADDWIFPEYIERMVDVMEKYPEAGICSSYRIDHTKVSCQGLDIRKGLLFKGNEILLEQLLNKIDVTGSETTVLYRLETLKKINSFPVIYSHASYHFDTTLAYELLNISDLAFVFQVLSYTRRHEETYTSKYVDRFRTSLNFREQELYKYRNLSPAIHKEYKLIRSFYGFYLLKAKIRHDRKSLEWHSKHLNKERKFSWFEYLSNVIAVFAFKVKYKLGRK